MPHPQGRYLELVSVVVISIVDLLSGLVLGLLGINEVQAAALDLTVDKGTGKASEDLLGLLVAGGLACYQINISFFSGSAGWGYLRTVLSNVVLVGLGCLVGSGTGNQLVDHGGVVLLLAVEGVVGLSLVGVI